MEEIYNRYNEYMTQLVNQIKDFYSSRLKEQEYIRDQELKVLLIQLQNNFQQCRSLYVREAVNTLNKCEDFSEFQEHVMETLYAYGLTMYPYGYEFSMMPYKGHMYPLVLQGELHAILIIRLRILLFLMQKYKSYNKPLSLRLTEDRKIRRARFKKEDSFTLEPSTQKDALLFRYTLHDSSFEVLYHMPTGGLVALEGSLKDFNVYTSFINYAPV